MSNDHRLVDACNGGGAATYVPEDIETRRNALVLFNAMRAAENAAQAAEYGDLPPEGEAEATAAREAYYAIRKASEAKWHAELEAINQKYLGEASAPVLTAAARAATNAYNDSDGDALMEDGDGNAVICAASGVPIYETDEVIEDSETGETFLRAALGLPPRPVEEEDLDEAA